MTVELSTLIKTSAKAKSKSVISIWGVPRPPKTAPRPKPDGKQTQIHEDTGRLDAWRIYMIVKHIVLRTDLLSAIDQTDCKYMH